MGLLLGVIALALGASALGIAITGSGHSGPAGSTGAPGAAGPQGPSGAAGANGRNGANGTNGAAGTNGAPGPGAVSASTFDTNTVPMTQNCTVYNSSELNFSASGPGTIVVTASVVVLIGHTTGAQLVYFVSLWNTVSACSPSSNAFVEGQLTPATPSGSYDQDASLVQTFPVTGAGTYSVEVIGEAAIPAGSTDSVEFYLGSISGEFYPS